MIPISFSRVNARKLALQNETQPAEKISHRTVKNNLTADNLLLFIESGSPTLSNDSQCKNALYLYAKLLQEGKVSDPIKRKIEFAINEKLVTVSDLDKIINTVKFCDSIHNSDLFFNTLEELENCDRIIRNESRLEHRFDLQKIIRENIGYGLRHTVFELCSLLDTYSISSKAKFNIALENVSYALFKSGQRVDLSEASELITEYFLTRDPIITDKEYDGYIDVLKENRFINVDELDVGYVFEAKNTIGRNYSDKVLNFSMECNDKNCEKHIRKALEIKNEKQASKYIETSIEMILDDNVSPEDSLLLMKSVYSLPLIGNVSKQFVDYKVELSKSKIKIKNKVTTKNNKNMIKRLLDDGELIDFAEFVSESSDDEDFAIEADYNIIGDEIILIEDYTVKGAKKWVADKIKEPEKDDSASVDAIIKGFKASNEKSPSVFKNMLTKLLTKSPDNIINETPSIFSVVRIMIYLGISAAVPLGPVFAAVLAFINMLLKKHLDLKQAEKLYKYLESEKEKAKKKEEKAKGKEKDIQKEYIETLDKCLTATRKFIENIDDESEAIQGGDDDFDFGDDDFNWESTIVMENTETSISIAEEALEVLKPQFKKSTKLLFGVADIFDNLPSDIADQFYNTVDYLMKEYDHDSILCSNCRTIIASRGSGKLIKDEEPGYIAQYEATCALQEILTEAKKEGKRGGFPNINTMKMACINFKKKAQNLHGKEQELWRNIDIATSQLYRGMQQALTSDRREGIIKGSIIPSFSKIIKYAISVGAVGLFTGPVGAVITAVGILGASKYLNERERKLLYDEIDTELQVVDKQIQLAENDGDMNQYRFLLNYQKKLQREKYRIKYGIHMSGRTIPELKGGRD